MGNFLDALFEAYEAASKHTQMTIEILLERGKHQISPEQVENFKFKKQAFKEVDFVNPEFELIIRPLLCSDLSDESELDCFSVYEQDIKRQVKILNKVGADFQLQIPRSLIVQNITFDAIDSNGGQDCYWDNSHMPLCKEGEFKPSQISQVCGNRNPLASLFSFDVIKQEIDDLPLVQRLCIRGCQFQNFFYDFGSLIRLPQR
jgi:hypothetical protein